MKTFDTDRLVLSPLNELHAALVLHELQDPRIYTHIADEPPTSLSALQERFRVLQCGRNSDGSELWINWIATQKETQEPIGWFQATVYRDAVADVSYLVFPDHWHRGYAQEACREVVQYLLQDLNCSIVQALIDTQNARSVRVVEALGFKRIGTIQNAATIRGRRSDEFRYRLVCWPGDSDGTQVRDGLASRIE